MSRHASCAGWKGRPKWPHVTPSHPTDSCLLSRPGVGVGVGVSLPMQHIFNSMQPCNRKQRSSFRINNKPVVQENRPLSCKIRHFAVAFPDDLHETSRAMQSSRRRRLSFRTMSICCLTTASTATPLRASSAGWQGEPKWPYVTPSDSTKSCMLSRPRSGVPLPMHYLSNSTQACHSKERRPIALWTSPSLSRKRL